MRETLIYAWLCPLSGRPMYVGKTSQPLALRMKGHLRLARKGDESPKYRWLAANPMARAVVLQVTSVALSSSVERRWVRRLSRYQLLNVATAGAGNPGVGRVKWTPEIDALLGVVTDSDIAARLGCERKTVSYRRKCLGIRASFDRSKNVAPPKNGGWNRTIIPAEIEARLGTQPDYVLAAEIGVDKSVISGARRRAGVMSYAELSGRNGKIRKGEPHRRWSKGDTPSARPPVAVPRVTV